MSDAPKKASRSDVESAIVDAMANVRVLDIVLGEANESPRKEGGERSSIIVDHETFLAWQHMCNHLTDSVRKVERLFYEAGR